KSYRQVTAIEVVLVVCVAGGIALMLPFVGGSQSPYYGGIAQIFVGAAVLVTWPTWLVIGVWSVVLLAYYLPIALLERDINVATLVVHSSFLLGIAAVAVICMRQRVRMSMQEHEASLALAKTNAAL